MVEADITWLAWWSDSDWIIRSVFIILMLLSLASWSMMFFKVWQFSATSKFERIARKLLHDKKVPQDIFKRLPPSTPSAHLIEELPATSRGEELKEFAGQVLREKRLELESGMTLLATVGNATPFIGLFVPCWPFMPWFVILPSWHSVGNHACPAGVRGCRTGFYGYDRRPGR